MPSGRAASAPGRPRRSAPPAGCRRSPPRSVATPSVPRGCSARTPDGMATMLNSWLVALTAGLVKPSTLIWNGSSRNAPETPPMEVKNEITNATSGGTSGETSTPDAAKCMSAARSSHGGHRSILPGPRRGRFQVSVGCRSWIIICRVRSTRVRHRPDDRSVAGTLSVRTLPCRWHGGGVVEGVGLGRRDGTRPVVTFSPVTSPTGSGGRRLPALAGSADRARPRRRR